MCNRHFFRWNPFTFGQEEFVIRGYVRLRIRSYLIGIDIKWTHESALTKRVQGCSRGHWKNPSGKGFNAMVLTGKSHTSIAVNIPDSMSLDGPGLSHLQALKASCLFYVFTMSWMMQMLFELLWPILNGLHVQERWKSWMVFVRLPQSLPLITFLSFSVASHVGQFILTIVTSFRIHAFKWNVNIRKKDVKVWYFGGT